MPTSSVLLIHHEGNLFNNPTLKCIVDCLLKKGYQIDLRYKKNNAPISDQKNLRLLPYGKFVGKMKSILYDKLTFKILARIAVCIDKFLLYRSEYDFIIAVDRHGAIEAGLLSQLTNLPWVFVSFEIMFTQETSVRYKKIEHELSQTCTFWIAQDEVRASQLVKQNGLDETDGFLLPVASRGRGQTKKPYLRDVLGIPKSKKVAIMVGTLSDWSMTKEIIQSAPSWLDEWVLIVHERYGKVASYLRESCIDKKALATKVYFSANATIAVDNMGSIFGNVDAGLAFYRPTYNCPHTGRNLIYLGRSSGKISTYLRYGLPVVMNDIGLLADDAREHHFGVVVSDPREIKDALSRVIPEMKVHAYQYFDNVLDFNNYSNTLMTRLEAIKSEVN